MIKPPRKLALRNDTLRGLTTTELTRAVGGLNTTEFSCTGFQAALGDDTSAQPLTTASAMCK
jgi:hypothetical protein